MHYRSGQLAALAGISSDSLRHYERKGVLPLPERTDSGYRQYPPESLTRVRLIRRALSLGFTLDELARIFRARQRGEPPCTEVRALAVKKLQQLEDKLRQLESLRTELRDMIADWDARLSRTKPGHAARLLDSLLEPQAHPGVETR